MRSKYAYFILALTMVASIATGGCGSGGSGTKNGNQNVTVNPSPVIPAEDPDASLLNNGKLVKGTVKEDCDNSVVLDEVNKLCELFKLVKGGSTDACITQTSSCNDYGRQIYTGSVLGPGPKGAQWNGRGGSGALMADAAVCTLRELSPKVPGGGPVNSSASLDIGIGDVVVKQEVGYLDFDRIYGRFKGYRKLRIELPVIGKFDAVTQDIDVKRVFYGTGQLFNEVPKAGDYPLLFAYGLNLSTEEKDKSINIDPGSFDVTTPIGQFQVSPHFTYKSNTVVDDMPFGTDHTYIILPDDSDGPDAIKLYDLYGVIPGINNNTVPPPSSTTIVDYKEKQTGWISQIGLGTRGSIDDKLWSPSPGPGGFFTRPDYDPGGALKFGFYESRSDEENRPSVYAEASASFKYPDNPADMLPDWVDGLPGLDWEAYIQVTPKIKAGAAGQFGIAVSEGTDNKKELSGEFYVGKPASRTSALGIYSGVEANASFEVLAELRLKVSAVFDFFFGSKKIDLIDIHPKFPIPLAGGKPTSSKVELAAAYSTSDNTVVLPETLDYLKTFKGVKNPKEFINLCYAKEAEVPPEDPPKSEPEKGDVTDLFEYLPCNICLATDAVIDSKTGDVKEPAHKEILAPVDPIPPIDSTTLAVWRCDAKSKSGCMDLCKLNKETGEFTVVKNPSEIADSMPTTDPDYNKLYPFYKSCMITCTPDLPPGILDTSCGKGLDSTPPSIFGIMVPGGGGGAPAPVPVSTNIAAPFSEPMDPVSINTSTFTVSDADGNTVAGDVIYNAATYTAIFTPLRSFNYNSRYTATITTGVRDAAGNPLAADFSWSFTTEAYADATPPTVSSTLPSSDATAVPLNTTVSVTFSETVDPSTVSPSTFTLSSGRAGSVSGTISFTDGGATATFTPSADLNYGNTYTVTLGTGIKDLAGNPLAAVYTWNFTTLSALMAEKRTVFVTSVQGNGNLSTWADAVAAAKTGLAAGDAICQARATAAGLNGDFVAWLSDDNNDAYCRVNNLTGKKSVNCGQPDLPVAAGPWVRTDGFPFSDTIDQLVNDGKVYAPVMYDESGILLPGSQNYLTGTKEDGTLDSTIGACYNWTSSSGEVPGVGGYTIGTTYSWTHNYSTSCGSSWHLLCLEKGAGLPLPPFATSGKKVFVTSVSGSGDLGTWPGAGVNRGVAAGDAVCQSLAAEAGLSNSANFKAWLSSYVSGTVVNAKDRLTSNGPWVRLDGVKVADNKADLTDGSLFTAISQTETGAYLSTTTWTGTYPNGTLNSILSTCEGWTNSVPVRDEGSLGESSLSSSYWTQDGYNPCSTLRHLFCFED